MRRPRLSPVASFLAGSVIAAWIMLAAPSDAHTGLYRERWVANKIVPYGFTPSAAAWKTRVNAGANTWSALGEPMRFTNSLPDFPSNFRPGVCSRTYQRNGIHRKAIDGTGGTLARTYLCTSGGALHSFQLVFDRGDRWYTGTGAPARNQADLQSVATHEFGHATGFAGHFSGSALCSNDASFHTMCAGHVVGTNRQRTLEEHDKHTFGAAY